MKSSTIAPSTEPRKPTGRLSPMPQSSCCPTQAPQIPSSDVTRQPCGFLPGMKNLATAPARKPITRTEIRYTIAPVRGDNSSIRDQRKIGVLLARARPVDHLQQFGALPPAGRGHLVDDDPGTGDRRE